MNTTVTCKVRINNVPDYATEGFIVARVDEHTSEFWFFGCYDTEETAKEVCQNVHGIYFEVA